jgi:hypothetical protein
MLYAPVLQFEGYGKSPERTQALEAHQHACCSVCACAGGLGSTVTSIGAGAWRRGGPRSVHPHTCWSSRHCAANSSPHDFWPGLPRWPSSSVSPLTWGAALQWRAIHRAACEWCTHGGTLLPPADPRQRGTLGRLPPIKSKPLSVHCILLLCNLRGVSPQTAPPLLSGESARWEKFQAETGQNRPNTG